MGRCDVARRSAVTALVPPLTLVLHESTVVVLAMVNERLVTLAIDCREHFA